MTAFEYPDFAPYCDNRVTLDALDCYYALLMAVVNARLQKSRSGNGNQDESQWTRSWEQLTAILYGNSSGTEPERPDSTSQPRSPLSRIIIKRARRLKVPTLELAAEFLRLHSPAVWRLMLFTLSYGAFYPQDCSPKKNEQRVFSVVDRILKGEY